MLKRQTEVMMKWKNKEKCPHCHKRARMRNNVVVCKNRSCLYVGPALEQKKFNSWHRRDANA